MLYLLLEVLKFLVLLRGALSCGISLLLLFLLLALEGASLLALLLLFLVSGVIVVGCPERFEILLWLLSFDDFCCTLVLVVEEANLAVVVSVYCGQNTVTGSLFDWAQVGVHILERINGSVLEPLFLWILLHRVLLLVARFISQGSLF